VPKENKRFINPLLRPSQDSQQEEQGQTVSAVKNSEPQAPKQSAPQVQQQIAQPQTNITHNDEATSARVIQDTPGSPTRVADHTYENVAASDSRTQGERVVNKDESALPSEVIPTRNRVSEEDNRRPAQSSVSTGRAATKASPSSSNGRGRASANAVREASYQRANANEAEEEPVQGYRRRVEVRFENMHERLTVWIDRGLKRGLEDLASRRNLSKTALINEAMADLLRKYNED
jgi:hypothetical protein